MSGHVGTRVAANGVGGCSWHRGGCLDIVVVLGGRERISTIDP